MTTPNRPPELAVEEIAHRLDVEEGAVILDVREPWEVELCRIEGSLNIPLAQISGRVGEIPGDVPVYVLCHHGMRSLKATLWLCQQGFGNICNIAGGIDRWSLVVDDTIPRYG